MAINLASLFLYKWRFIVGYIILSLFLITLLLVSGTFAPNGLSKSEINSVIESGNLYKSVFNNSNLVDAPYHQFQNLILSSFGINHFYIKLPSLIIGFFTFIGMIVLLSKWFRGYIAVLASLIAITTGQLLFLSQNGSPTIMPVFWSVWLVLFATLIAKRSRYVDIYKVLFFIFAALSLYTPLSAYILLGLVLTALIHPHLRFVVINLSRIRLMIAGILGLVLLYPLIRQIFYEPKLLFELIGIPNQVPNLVNNVVELSSFYFGFNDPSAGEIMKPIFGMGSMALVGLGLFSILKSRSTAQSYLIIALILCYIPVIIINPSLTAITLLPLVIMLTFGLYYLINYWYRLFPKNPYARVAGFIPISLLIVSLSFSGLERYFYGYRYDANVASSFSLDLALLPNDSQTLVVSEAEIDFYQSVAKYRSNLIVNKKSDGDILTYTKEASKNPPNGYTIINIITSGRSNDSDRFYVFKKSGS